MKATPLLKRIVIFALKVVQSDSRLAFLPIKSGSAIEAQCHTAPKVIQSDSRLAFLPVLIKSSSAIEAQCHIALKVIQSDSCLIF